MMSPPQSTICLDIRWMLSWFTLIVMYLHGNLFNVFLSLYNNLSYNALRIYSANDKSNRSVLISCPDNTYFLLFEVLKQIKIKIWDIQDVLGSNIAYLLNMQ